MPIFRSGTGQVPAWCEMTAFEIVTLGPGERHVFERAAPKEKLIVCRGNCRVAAGDRIVAAAQAGTNLDLATDDDRFEVDEVLEETVLVRLCGRWGDEVGGSGLFAVAESAAPVDKGDPVSYPKATTFDAHFHDCDEYWIIWEGRGVAVSEGRSYDVGPGDCVATGMGHHHDFPRAHEPVRAVYFETTLEGAKRRGHLWEHTHGTAEPRPERV